MPEELGTKDVLEQVNVRLSNVEHDVRELRTEMNSRFENVERGFDRVYQDLAGVRSEVQDLYKSVDQRFMWLYGLMVAVLVAVAGLWFK